MWLLNLIVFDKSELFFLRIFQTPAELAYYSIAFGLTARLAAAGDSISYVLFPIFITRYTQNGANDLRDFYRRSIRYLQMLMVPIFVWGIALAPRLVVLVYGVQYARVAPVVQVLLGTMFLTVTMTISTSVVYTLDRQHGLFRFMIGVAAINIFLDFMFVPRFGAVGAAISNGLSQLCAVCSIIVLLQKTLPGSFPFFESLKIYLAAAVSISSILYAELVVRGGILVLCVSTAGGSVGLSRASR